MNSMPPKLEKDADTVRVQIVAPSTWLVLIDDWRAKQRPIPNRSEAIRMIVEQAIGSKADDD